MTRKYNRRMPRQELHSTQLPPIQQQREIPTTQTLHDPFRVDPDDIEIERVGSLEDTHAAELAFMEEPVTIRIEPSTDKNAGMHVPVWVNGRGADVFFQGKWVPIGHLPVGLPLTVKRSTVEVLIRSKTDSITTQHENANVEMPRNMINRSTSSQFVFSTIHDANPRGPAWQSELMRRNL